jgi:hypothetical protein
LLNCISARIAEARPGFRQPEKLLYRIWLDQSFTQQNLRTVTGKSVSILACGVRNECEGPDFKEARILLEGEFQQGDVELHYDNQDWYQHGHQNDPAYNQVILHVVVRCEPPRTVETQNRRQVPVLVIPLIQTNKIEHQLKCLDWSGTDKDALKSVLEHFAQLRFQRKVRFFQNELARVPAEELFYIYCLDALGYSRNREAFRTLAQRLPIMRVYALLADIELSNRIVLLETLYLGSAGLLSDSARAHFTETDYLMELRKRWQQLRKQYGLTEMDPTDWHFAGTRPANHPTRRIVAWAQILNRFYPDFPGQLWIRQLSVQQDYRLLMIWLQDYYQEPVGMWRNHPLFDRQPTRILVGNARILDLCSNVFLPFAWAVGTLQKENKLVERSLQSIRLINRGAVPEKIKEFLKRLGLSSSDIHSNYLLQGAIEYYRCYCELDLCEFCQLKHVNG